jgi:hypothetical protein
MTLAFGKFPMACIFSFVEIILIDLRRLKHITFASANASAKSGSFPDGNAPACRETIKVELPTGTTPEFVAAQPDKNSMGHAISTRIFIFYLLIFIVVKKLNAPEPSNLVICNY